MVLIWDHFVVALLEYSTNLYSPFININWGTKNVLQNTIDNFATTKLRYKFLDKKIDVDTIIDIENRK